MGDNHEYLQGEVERRRGMEELFRRLERLEPFIEELSPRLDRIEAQIECLKARDEQVAQHMMREDQWSDWLQSLKDDVRQMREFLGVVHDVQGTVRVINTAGRVTRIIAWTVGSVAAAATAVAVWWAKLRGGG